MDRRALWKKMNPMKARAHKLLGHAVANGLVLKKPCYVCDCKNVHAHHWNYSHPLKVIWMCAKHHKETHFWLNILYPNSKEDKQSNILAINRVTTLYHSHRLVDA